MRHYPFAHTVTPSNNAPLVQMEMGMTKRWPHHTPLTPEQLMARAVERMQTRRAIEGVRGEPTSRRRSARRQAKKVRLREKADKAFAAAAHRIIDAKYLHSSRTA